MSPTPPSGQPWTELEKCAYLRESPLTEASCLKVSPDGRRMCIKERGHTEPCDETAQVPSGQYGELREAAIKALSAPNRTFTTITPNRALSVVHPIYVTELEAKDRELAVVRKLLEENRTAVDAQGEQLEAKDREIGSLVLYWSNSTANRIHAWNPEEETARKWLDALISTLSEQLFAAGQQLQEQAAEIARRKVLYDELIAINHRLGQERDDSEALLNERLGPLEAKWLQAEQREAEARRLLASLVEMAELAHLGKLQKVVAAKNFLESKP